MENIKIVYTSERNAWGRAVVHRAKKNMPEFTLCGSYIYGAYDYEGHVLTNEKVTCRACEANSKPSNRASKSGSFNTNLYENGIIN